MDNDNNIDNGIVWKDRPTEMTMLHCEMCQNNEAWTIFEGSALCHHCFGQMDKARTSIQNSRIEHEDTVLEIRKNLQAICEHLGIKYRKLGDNGV